MWICGSDEGPGEVKMSWEVKQTKVLNSIFMSNQSMSVIDKDKYKYKYMMDMPLLTVILFQTGQGPTDIFFQHSGY